MKSLFIVFLLFSSLSFAGESSAFKAFGEKKGIDKLTLAFHHKLLADKRMKDFFKNSDHDRFLKHFATQVCETLGGPCKYKGQNMRRAHKGHTIKRSDFFYLVEVFQVVMKDHKIPVWAQNKLLSKFASMHKDIVNDRE